MTPNYGRLAGAVVAVVIGLAVLWQAGILFSSNNTSTAPVSLAAPDTSVDTPAVEGRNVGLKPGDLAPNFEFSSIDGKRLKLSDFRGRAVLVNFWATWCLPCRSEMPDIQAAQDKYSSDKVAVLAINQGESYNAIKGWVDDLHLHLTAFGYDPKNTVYNLYFNGGVQGLPVSYFVDGQGVITKVVLGPLKSSDLDTAFQDAIAGYSSSAGNN